ncbi:MAG: hypothetical protein ACLUNZ_07620 [Evtepia sp.]
MDASWFDDAAFVGDSVSVTLANYNSSYGTLGKAKFFCSVSLSQTNALSYQAGNERLPEYPAGSGQHFPHRGRHRRLRCQKSLFDAGHELYRFRG